MAARERTAMNHGERLLPLTRNGEKLERGTRFRVGNGELVLII